MTTEPPPPQGDDSPPRLFGLAFWAAMVFAILCIGAGYLFAHLAPRLFPAAPAPAHSGGPGRFNS